jgi:hypothetical protein
MECSAIRDRERRREIIPDCAALHPGYGLLEFITSKETEVSRPGT